MSVPGRRCSRRHRLNPQGASRNEAEQGKSPQNIQSHLHFCCVGQAPSYASAWQAAACESLERFQPHTELPAAPGTIPVVRTPLVTYWICLGKRCARELQYGPRLIRISVPQTRGQIRSCCRVMAGTVPGESAIVELPSCGMRSPFRTIRHGAFDHPPNADQGLEIDLPCAPWMTWPGSGGSRSR